MRLIILKLVATVMMCIFHLVKLLWLILMLCLRTNCWLLLKSAQTNRVFSAPCQLGLSNNTSLCCCPLWPGLLTNHFHLELFLMSSRRLWSPLFLNSLPLKRRNSRTIVPLQICNSPPSWLKSVQQNRLLIMFRVTIYRSLCSLCIVPAIQLKLHLQKFIVIFNVPLTIKRLCYCYF